MKREEDFGRQDSVVDGLEEMSPPLVEASSFWYWFGLLLVTSYTMLSSVIGAITMKEGFRTYAQLFMPIALLLSIIALLSQPRRRNPGHMRKLRFLFMILAYVSEGAWLVKEINKVEPQFWTVLSHLIRAAIWTIIFNWSLKLRAAFGKLSDKGKQINRSI